MNATINFLGDVGVETKSQSVRLTACLQKFSCLSLLGAKITDASHHSWPAMNMIIFEFFYFFLLEIFFNVSECFVYMYVKSVCVRVWCVPGQAPEVGGESPGIGINR